jgi:hypothetical protein
MERRHPARIEPIARKSISLVSLVQFFVLSFDRTKAIHEFTRNSTNKTDFRFVYFRGSILSGKEVFSR